MSDKKKESDDLDDLVDYCALQEALDGSAIYIAHVDKNCRFTRCFNVEPILSVIGRLAEEIVNSPSQRQLTDLRRTAMATGITQIADLELEGIPRLGTAIYQVTVFPRRDGTGQVSGAATVLVDITKRKQAETIMLELNETLRRRLQQMQQRSEEDQASMTTCDRANRVKTEFLATMSHELRTPMTAILGMVELLSTSKPDLIGQQRVYLQTILQSGQHLLRLVNTLLDYTKLETGAMQLERVAFNFHAMLQEMVTLFSAIVVKKHCLISLDPSNVPEYILSDPVRLRQVLLNLISNACKFTSKGCIDIKVCLSSPIEKPLSPGDKVRVRVSVKDTGIGMTKEISNRLFKPFTQADSSITRLYGGSGMGLSISAKIVELMEGRIGVESEVDKGSTFWFEIPTEVAASSANIVTLLHADVAAVLDQTPKLDVKDDVLVSEQLDVKDDAPARARVLLVDDNLVNQKVIKALLQRLHCEVDLASSGQEAINKFKGQPEGTYQLVLMDIHMPGKDGHQTARELRSFEQTARLPVFIAALTADVASLKETVEAGMNAFLGKPVTLHDLEIVLNETGKFRKGLIITVPC